MQDWVLWVTEAQCGDLAAFDGIVRQFKDMAVAYAYSILSDFPLAEDAAQEAFIQAYCNLKALQEPRAFPAWLRRIIVGQCDRFYRKKRPPTISLDATAELADPGSNPLEAIQQREARDTVLSAVNALPENERTATALFYINGYSMAEVGEFLEVPVSTVKNRLHSARKHLQERMVGAVEETLQRHAPGDDFRRRVHKVLEGIERTPWESIWLCFEGSMYACMRYLGEDTSLHFLMGASGGAFRFVWHPDSSPALCNLFLLGEEPVRRLFAALGYDCTYVWDRKHKNPANSKERYTELIVESIDSGKPVIALGVLAPPGESEPCVITGYDKGGDVLYGKSYFQEQEQGYFRADEWYESCHGLLLFGEKCTKPARRQLLADSLAWAVELSRKPVIDLIAPIRDDGTTWHYSGLAAYDPLAAEFLRDERFTDDPAVLSFSIERTMYDGIWFLMEQRQNASLYLAEFAGEGHPGSEELARAAAAYAEEAKALRSASEFVPIEASEKCCIIADPAVRRELNRIVKEAKVIEERAVGHLERALERLRA